MKLPALGIALTYLFMVALYGIGLLPADRVDALRGEGGMVETPGEFAFLIASVAFLVAYGKSLGRGSDLGFVRFRRNSTKNIVALMARTSCSTCRCC